MFTDLVNGHSEAVDIRGWGSVATPEQLWCHPSYGAEKRLWFQTDHGGRLQFYMRKTKICETSDSVFVDQDIVLEGQRSIQYFVPSFDAYRFDVSMDDRCLVKILES